jgi:hypothetical protein
MQRGISPKATEKIPRTDFESPSHQVETSAHCDLANLLSPGTGG